MYNFLVLGYIPGTNIQLSLAQWLIISLLSYVVYRHYKSRLINLAIKLWQDFDNLGAPKRHTLHANQLHLRAL